MVEPALWRRRRLVPLYRTKVFADGTTRKIIEVTLGELRTIPVKDKRPYKQNEVGSEASGVFGRLNSTIGLVKAKLTEKGIWSVDGEGNRYKEGTLIGRQGLQDEEPG